MYLKLNRPCRILNGIGYARFSETRSPLPLVTHAPLTRINSHYRLFSIMDDTEVVPPQWKTDLFIGFWRGWLPVCVQRTGRRSDHNRCGHNANCWKLVENQAKLLHIPYDSIIMSLSGNICILGMCPILVEPVWC